MIYFIQDTSVLNIKIGYTAGDPESRRAALQTGSPAGLVLIGFIEGDQSFESYLHKRFVTARVHGEWFRPVPELIQFIVSTASTAAVQVARRSPVPATLIQRRPWPLNIYLAGKISGDDWRKDIVDGLGRKFLCEASTFREKQVEAIHEEWPVLKASIFREHNYVGPYFVYTEDDLTPSHSPHVSTMIMESGEDAHGVGLQTITFLDKQFKSPKAQIVKQCFDAIDRADLVFAWIDSLDCYGTIAEIGYAAARKKMLYVSARRSFRDMWFIHHIDVENDLSSMMYRGDDDELDPTEHKPARILERWLEAYQETMSGGS